MAANFHVSTTQPSDSDQKAWPLHYVTPSTNSLHVYIYIGKGKDISRTTSMLVSANTKFLLRIESILAYLEARSALTILKVT